MKTQAKWNEQNYLKTSAFAGKTHAEKQAEIDEALEDGRLSIENYKHLNKAISEQYQIAEHEMRLKALEDQVNNPRVDKTSYPKSDVIWEKPADAEKE